MATEFKTSQKNKSKIKTWMLAGICVIVLGAASFTWYCFNKPLFYCYKYVWFGNPCKPGDKLYINSFLVDKASAKDFSRYNDDLYRLARPLNNDEVDAMNISLAEKALIKQDLSKKKPYMAVCGWAISTDSLSKYKSAFISTYSTSKISYLYFDNNKYIPSVFFAVHPIGKTLIRNPEQGPPSGYTFDDHEPFFMKADEFSRTDSKSFRDVK